MCRWLARGHRREIPAWFAPAVVLGLLTICGACRNTASPTGPTPAPPAAPSAHSGPVTITLLEATPAPGSTVTGCGAQIAGCVNRVRMRFVLSPPASGPVLHVVAYLHATNKVACLSALTGPFELQQGQSRSVELVFDRADNCGVPVTISTMAVVVEGTVEVASRQEWTIGYLFER